MSRPVSTRDLLPSERTFVTAVSRLGFGRFEYLRIERGELVLDPWPTVVRDVKFGSQDPGAAKIAPDDFELMLTAASEGATLAGPVRAKARMPDRGIGPPGGRRPTNHTGRRGAAGKGELVREKLSGAA